MQTKIHQLDINKNKYCIEVNLVFSIDIEDEYYSAFLADTLNFRKLDTNVFKLDDYVQYLEDKVKYDELNIEPLHTLESRKEGFIPIYLKPSPYSNLLHSSINNLIQLNHDYLSINEQGYFVFHEFVDNTNTTRGILKDLQRVFKGKEVNTRTTLECWLYRAIKALDMHWN